MSACTCQLARVTAHLRVCNVLALFPRWQVLGWQVLSAYEKETFFEADVGGAAKAGGPPVTAAAV